MLNKILPNLFRGMTTQCSKAFMNIKAVLPGINNKNLLVRLHAYLFNAGWLQRRCVCLEGYK